MNFKNANPLKTSVVAFALISSASFHAHALDCSTVKNSSKRLQCFDEQSRKSDAQKATESTEIKDRLAAEKTAQEKEKTLNAAQSAYKALKKLSIRIETGINYSDYVSALADTKYEVSNFLDDSSSKTLPEISNRIELVLLHYEFARTAWSIRVNQAHRQSSVTREMKVVFDKVLEEKMRSNYANMSVAAASRFQGYLDYDKALGVIFGEASTELVKLGELLKK